MKIKSHKEIINGHNTITFFCEDVQANMLIHSDTFIVTKKTKIKELKADFTRYVCKLNKLELNAIEHKLVTKRKELVLNN